MKALQKLALSSFLLLASTAHAGFADVEYHVAFTGDSAFGVAVIDSRDFISSDPRKANLLGGEVSGVFGRRKELLTDSRKPVAEEIADGLRIHFADKKKAAVAVVPQNFCSSLEQLKSSAPKLSLKRIIVLDVQNIWVDMANAKNTQVAYQIDAIVLDDAGKTLAKQVDSGLVHSREWGTTASDEIVGRAISTLLAHPEITKAMAR